MFSKSAQPTWSQRSSTIVAAALLTGGLATFLFTTASAPRQQATQRAETVLPAMNYSQKPSPLVPLSPEEARRLAHAVHHARRAAESSPLPPSSAAVAIIR